MESNYKTPSIDELIDSLSDILNNKGHLEKQKIKAGENLLNELIDIEIHVDFDMIDVREQQDLAKVFLDAQHFIQAHNSQQTKQ